MKISFKNAFVSVVAATLLVGCGSGGGSGSTTPSGGVTSNTVTVERGAVYGADVKDSSSTPQTGRSVNNTNVYEFDNPPVYPIVVTPTSNSWIDVNGDGVLGVGDAKLGIPMKSYSNVVTPVTTYIAEVVEKKPEFTGASQDEIETLIDSELESLVSALNENLDNDDQIEVNDLKLSPTELKDKGAKGALIGLNAVYTELEKKKPASSGGDFSSFTIADIKNEIDEIEKLLTDDKTLEELEELVINDFIDDGGDVDLIDDGVELDLFEEEYTIFDREWVEEKGDNYWTISKDNKVEVSNDANSVKLVAAKNTKSGAGSTRAINVIKTEFEDDVNAVSLNVTPSSLEGDYSKVGFLLTAEVSLSDEKKNEILAQYSSADLSDVKLDIELFISENSIQANSFISDKTGAYEMRLGSFILVENLQNNGKTLNPQFSIVDGIVKLEITGLDDTLGETLDEGISISSLDSLQMLAYYDIEGVSSPSSEKTEAIFSDFKVEKIAPSNITQAIRVIKNVDIEKDNINAKIDQAKALVENETSNEAIMIKSMLDLTSILETSEVQAILDIQTPESLKDASIVNKIIKSTVNKAIKIRANANNFSQNSNFALHNLSHSLYTLSEDISSVFVNEDYVFEYENEKITYKDSLAINSSILALSYALAYSGGFSYGDDADLEVKTKIIDGIEYEYQDVVVDPASVVNKGKFLTIAYPSTYGIGQASLFEALLFAKELKVGDYGLTDKQVQDIDSAFKSMTTGTFFEIEDNEEETISVNLKAFTNPTTALDINDFGSDYTYTCPSGYTYNKDESIRIGEAMCKDFLGNIKSATLKAAVEPTKETSNLDEVLKIVDKTVN